MHIENRNSKWCCVCGTSVDHIRAPIHTETGLYLCGYSCSLKYTQQPNKYKQKERQSHEQNDTVQTEHMPEESSRTSVG